VSIITKSEIRYEGTLFKINPDEKNITLQYVRSYGTEGRRPGNEIQASSQTYEQIVFKGTDIKDLMILGSKSETPAQTQPQENKV
jgi:protein LSM14